jgi:hypothetical protein
MSPHCALSAQRSAVLNPSNDSAPRSASSAAIAAIRLPIRSNSIRRTLVRTTDKSRRQGQPETKVTQVNSMGGSVDRKELSADGRQGDVVERYGHITGQDIHERGDVAYRIALGDDVAGIVRGAQVVIAPQPEAGRAQIRIHAR